MRTSTLTILASLALASCGRDLHGAGGDRAMIKNKGSDTLVNVALAWAEKYKEVNPDVAISVSGGGSGTGISALINGTVGLANTSRKMKEKEIELARANGVDPREFLVGYDALAVYVHKDNTLETITLAQLADIYGEGGSTVSWDQLGVEVPGCDSSKIIRLSRQNNSGTFVYFKKAVLGKGNEYKLGSLDLHGSKDVVDTVLRTPCAIGFSGLAYAVPDVRTVKIKKDSDSPAVAPSTDSAIDGSYPIARPLFMYTAGEPTGAVKEYLEWILTDEGQRIILEKGYAPIRELPKD